MTPAEHTAQRDLVTASLAAVHHPDTYPISRTGYHARPAESGRDRVSAVPSRNTPSHAPRPTPTGRDGQGAAPTRECEYCDGKGTKTGPNGEAWRCHACKGRGRLIDQPTPRAIPNTRRFM